MRFRNSNIITRIYGFFFFLNRTAETMISEKQRNRPAPTFKNLNDCPRERFARLTRDVFIYIRACAPRHGLSSGDDDDDDDDVMLRRETRFNQIGRGYL